jgi:hypothetical protein
VNIAQTIKLPERQRRSVERTALVRLRCACWSFDRFVLNGWHVFKLHGDTEDSVTVTSRT